MAQSKRPLPASEQPHLRRHETLYLLRGQRTLWSGMPYHVCENEDEDEDENMLMLAIADLTLLHGLNQ